MGIQQMFPDLSLAFAILGNFLRNALILPLESRLESFT
jgi:hypothetical protein